LELAKVAAEVDATITTYPAGGLETEVAISPPVLEPEVAVCPPLEADAVITTYPAGGLEEEVIIAAPSAEVAVCPPVEDVAMEEEEAVIIAAPSAEVAVCPPVEDVAMEDEEEADAFDFFSPEPIGSRARDLEREQELALLEASKVTAVVTSSESSEVTAIATSSESAGAETSTWITETETVITTTTKITTTTEDGVVSEKTEVNVTNLGGDVQIVEVVESSAAATAAADVVVAATTEAVVESSVSSAEAAVAVSMPSEVVTPVATFYTEEMRSVAEGEPEVVEEGFRVVGPSGAEVPEDVLEEAGHPEMQ